MLLNHLSDELRGAVVSIPGGRGGIMATLAAMCQMRDAAKVDPRIRARVAAMLLLQPGRDAWAELGVIFRYVRDRVRYLADVVDVETLTMPETTLRMLSGDCDDQALALATMLEVAGYPTHFVAAGYDPTRPGAFEHVFVRAQLPSGDWVALDPSEQVPPGWEPPQEPVAYWEEAC